MKHFQLGHIARFSIVLLILILRSNYCSAQNDSLLSLLSNCKSDTAKFRLCNEISLRYSAKDNATAIYFANEATKIAVRTKDKKGEGVALNNLGYALYYSGESDSAITIFNRCIEISKETGDKTIAAFSYNRLGYIAREKGDNAKALKYYHQSLSSNPDEKNIPEAAFAYLNIGVIYDDQDNFKEALKYEKLGLELYQKTGDDAKVANCYARIGNSYMNSADSTTAMTYYLKAIPLFEKGNSKRGVAICYNNIAMILETRKQREKALEYYMKAVAIRESIGDKNGMAILYNNIGTNYFTAKNYDKAIIYYNLSLQLSEELGFTDNKKENNLGLSIVYEKMGDYKMSLSYFKQYHNLYDTLFNKDKSNQINELNAQFESELKAKKIELLSKDAKITAGELERKSTQTWILFFGLLAVIALAFVIFRSAMKSRKANVVLEKQKNEIASQKKIVEEQHHDILDSINYAKRIQSAVLPTQEEIQQLFPKSFVYFKPRDIVSGDFWWIGGNEKIKIIAVADCTGHGVPGAFMSLIGNTALNEIVKEKHIYDPGEILTQLAHSIVTSLKQANQSESELDKHYFLNGVKDGMDISICCIDEKNNTLKFAGANNPLYYISNGMVAEIKGNRQPVGIFQGELKPFSVHQLELNTIDAFYLFSDGYADQFGGENGKKFKYSQLKELLLSIYQLSPTEQNRKLNDTLQKWKGKLDQVDDICVVGVKLV